MVQSKICKGLKVSRMCRPPVSMVGMLLRVDSQTLVVSLTHDDGPDRTARSVGQAGDVQVSATADDALYHFTSTLLQSSGLLLYLSPPREVRRVQRRDNVRQPCLFDVEMVMPGSERAPAKRERATAVNISCGGLLIVFEGRLVVGDAVDLSMKLLRGEPPIQATARVIRTEPFSRIGQNLSRVALRVVGLQRADERRLTQFIAKCQVKIRTGVV